jgi:predicted short-subunit dehydrogenase-like oxidoreductase (DUF2520 family)
MKTRRSLRIAIIGAGSVGNTLGRLSLENGGKVVCVVSRTERSAHAAGRFLRCRTVSTDLHAIPRTADVLLIATPHSAVEEVARALAQIEEYDYSGVAVCHTSGMLTAEALDPLARRGGTVFSFHPLQTFPRDFPPRAIVPTAKGITYGVDGSSAGLRAARRLARVLQGRVLEIPVERRALYHATCVVASNHLTALISVVESLHKLLGTKEEDFYRVFKPIVMATLRNIERTSAARALSGPVARGGVETVARHFEAVARYAPDMIPYFVQMSKETVRLAEAKGSISAAQREAMAALLHAYENPTTQVPQ